jgi:hypothetical protein
MRNFDRKSVLVLLVSLLIAHDLATAFIPSSRRQQFSHSNAQQTDIDCGGCKRDTRTSTRLLATTPSSSDKFKTTTANNRNEKSTTELRAATGISLSSPSIASPTFDDSKNSGLGVLFLNLGGPTTGDDVEGASEGLKRWPSHYALYADFG